MMNNFGILVVLKNNPKAVVHAVMFEEEPTQADWLDTYNELESDEKYNLIGKKFYLLPATKKDIEEILAIPNKYIEEVYPHDY